MVRIFWRPELDPDVSEEERDEQWSQLCAPLFERAVTLGGTVVGWDQRDLTVDFAWDGLYDAIDFLVDAPLAPEFASGIAVGPVVRVVESGRVAIGLGTPLREVAQLVQLARPGEVLMTPAVFERANGCLGTTGKVGSRPGRPHIDALVLDPSRPFLGSEVPGPPSSSEGFELVSTEALEDSPTSRTSETFLVRQVERMVETAEVVDGPDGGVFAPEVSSALQKRDAESLLPLASAARLKQTGEAAARLEAIAQLAGGQSGEALRRLRRAKEAAAPSDSSARCRAALALGVALASSGRTYEAALEVLEALAEARGGQDLRGETACARFLAQIAVQFRDSASRDAWAELGRSSSEGER